MKSKWHEVVKEKQRMTDVHEQFRLQRNYNSGNHFIVKLQSKVSGCYQALANVVTLSSRTDENLCNFEADLMRDL